MGVRLSDALGEPRRKQHYGEETGKGPGDTIEVVVWKDEAERIVEVPAQFENLMKKEGLLPVFKKLSYTHRKEYCRWIAEAKKEETRLKRLEIDPDGTRIELMEPDTIDGKPVPPSAAPPPK